MASVVLFYGGRTIYRRAWAGITTATFSMETLITVGSFSAYFYSIYGLLRASIHLYFDTSSMLLTDRSSLVIALIAFLMWSNPRVESLLKFAT